MNPDATPINTEELLLAFAVELLVVACVALVVTLVIEFFFCRTVARCLRKVDPDNREMEPGRAYLHMIPLFNVYWTFPLTAAVSDSLANEFRYRRWRPDGDFGRSLGNWMGVCNLIGLVFSPAGLAALVFWVRYWVKVAEISRELDPPAEEDR